MLNVKTLILSAAFSLTLAYSFAQSVDYNTIIIPENIKNVDIKEKLVQLAWNNNPENRIVENNILIAQKTITIHKSEWLDLIRINGNLNEFTINPSALPSEKNSYYPRYNISAYLNLGMLISTPAKTKIAKIDHQNQVELQNSQKLRIRAQVLRLYEVYRKNKEILKIQTDLSEEAYSSYLIAEQQFKNGEITLEEWNQNFKYYNSQSQLKIQRESELEISKIDLEEVIGINIDDVLKAYQE